MVRPRATVRYWTANANLTSSATCRTPLCSMHGHCTRDQDCGCCMLHVSARVLCVKCWSWAAASFVEADLVDMQELVEIIGRSTGIALMAPPTDSKDAQTTLDTLLSAVNKKQKVYCTILSILHYTALYCMPKYIFIAVICIALQASAIQCRSYAMHWPYIQRRACRTSCSVSLAFLVRCELQWTCFVLPGIGSGLSCLVCASCSMPHYRALSLAGSQSFVPQMFLLSQVLIVESYGGRDEPVDTLINNFVGVGVEPALDPVRVKEVPNESTYQVHHCCQTQFDHRCCQWHPMVMPAVRLSGKHSLSGTAA